MTKIHVSLATYGELYRELERAGRTLNDGKPLTIEKGEAIIPPVDFRLSGLRQNCLVAASNIFKNSEGNHNALEFINFCEALFNWSLKGDKPEVPKLNTWANQKG